MWNLVCIYLYTPTRSWWWLVLNSCSFPCLDIELQHITRRKLTYKPLSLSEHKAPQNSLWISGNHHFPKRQTAAIPLWVSSWITESHQSQPATRPLPSPSSHYRALPIPDSPNLGVIGMSQRKSLVIVLKFKTTTKTAKPKFWLLGTSMCWHNEPDCILLLCFWWGWF